MIYNMCLHFHGVLSIVCLTLATAFVLISVIKEKRDERKRA